MFQCIGLVTVLTPLIITWVFICVIWYQDHCQENLQHVHLADSLTVPYSQLVTLGWVTWRYLFIHVVFPTIAAKIRFKTHMLTPPSSRFTPVTQNYTSLNNSHFFTGLKRFGGVVKTKIFGACQDLYQTSANWRVVLQWHLKSKTQLYCNFYPLHYDLFVIYLLSSSPRWCLRLFSFYTAHQSPYTIM